MRRGLCLKRVGHLFEKICEVENIKEAIRQSSKGKRNHKRVKEVVENADKYAEQLREMLLNKRYTPSPYVTRTIYDGTARKKREICKPRYYPDQVVHWALMLQLQPVIMRGMYEYNCGSIPGRGTSCGQKTLRRWLDRDYRGTKYCLKMDVSQFYPSVDNEILKTMFRRKVKDAECLWLIDVITDSAEGLPIGNFTSQWFANFYLEGLDHFIKQQLGVKYYLRYVDDLVLLGSNKKKLHKARTAIERYLVSIGLRLKGNWQVFRVNNRAIDFLGFRFYRNKTTLRKRNALRIRRRMRKIAKKRRLSYRDACAIISYWGWVKRSDSYMFYYTYIVPCVSIKQARRTVSSHAKLRNYTARQTNNNEPSIPRGEACGIRGRSAIRPGEAIRQATSTY